MAERACSARGGLAPASKTMPARARISPMMAGVSRPCPVDKVSPKTVSPKITLANRVTALLEAMAGASTSVFSADCWITKQCEEMCYFFAHLYRERFGKFPETGSGISRESCSNATGWAS
jgi:hypothetical protein